MSETWHFCQDCGEEAGATKERDELREQVARLEEERDVAYESRAHWNVKCGYAMIDADRLRAALEKYGYHTAECPAFLEMPATAPPCTCGLREALEVER